VLEREQKDGKTTWWTGLSGPLFKNEYANAEKGQLKFTGLTDEGETKYNEYLEHAKAARKNAVMRQFEKDHLVWYKNKHGIIASDYESEMARRANLNATAGIAQDTQEEMDYDDSHLFDKSDEDSDGSDDE